jgi:hypothetical protein
VLKNAPVEWPKLRQLGRLLRRYQYTRRFASRHYGMVGFVKQLADANSEGSSGVRKESRFSDMLIIPGLVMITKGDAVE